MMRAISGTSFIITSHHQNIIHLVTFYFTQTEPISNEMHSATMIKIFLNQKVFLLHDLIYSKVKRKRNKFRINQRQGFMRP